MVTQGTPFLVGRSSELDQLARVLAAAGTGQAQLVLIEGEAGIGKSRLVQETIRQAADLGLAVFHAQAEELERRRPFGAVAESLGVSRNSAEARRAEIADLLFYSVPEEARLGGTWAEGSGTEFRIVDAMAALVEAECSRGPILLAIEDLQWADPSTLLVLNRLARSLDSISGVLLLSRRLLPTSSDLQKLIDLCMQCGLIHLQLQPLDDGAMAALAEALLKAKPGPVLMDQVLGARGNPFLAIELVEALERQGAIERLEDGLAEIREASLPPSLRVTILHRLSFLQRETLEALRVASVLGSSFAVTDLSLVLDRPPTTLLSALDESVRAGVLDEEGARLRFRHDLIRGALYEDMPNALRVGLHLQAARALAGAGSPLSQVAEHLMRGAGPSDAQAVQWLVRAGREAAPRAPSVAVELLGRALELSDPGEPGRQDLQADLAMSLVWSGRALEAQDICRTALRQAQDPAVETKLRMCLTQTLLTRGNNEQALKEIEEAMHSSTVSETDRARFQAWTATARMALGDFEGASRDAESARVVGDALGDNLTRSVAMGILAVVKRCEGHFHEGLDLAQQAVDMADRTPGREGHRFPLNVFRGLLLLDLDRSAEAQAVIQEGRRISETLGVPAAIAAYHWLSALGHFLSGAWDDAVSDCAVSLAFTEETGTRQGLLFTYAVTSMIALHRNDLRTAQEALAAADREFEGKGPQVGLDWIMWARGLVLEALGQPEAALAVLLNAWTLCTAGGLVADYRVLGLDIVRLTLLARDKPASAQEVVRALTNLADGANVATLTAAALRCRGLLEQSPDLLVEAAAAYRHGGRPLELALACEDAGHALGRAGRMPAARELFEEALELFEELGAARDVARTGSGMRQFGFRRGPRGRRGRAKTGWSSLTGSELRVVHLVAESLTNRQIAERLVLSPRTVQTHISNALTKLGVRSRVALAAEALRRLA